MSSMEESPAASFETPLLHDHDGKRRLSPSGVALSPRSCRQAQSEGHSKAEGGEPGLPTGRRRFVDVGRGVSILLMIFVNNCDEEKPVWIVHSVWDGLHLADVVMPCFLFIVGVSVVLSLQKHLQTRNPQSLKASMVNVAARAAKLFILGVVLQGGTEADRFPAYNLQRVRIMGILQRIALCYLLTGSLFLLSCWRSDSFASHQIPADDVIWQEAYAANPRWWLWTFAVATFVLYTLSSVCIPVPSCVYVPAVTPACNLASYVDQALLSSDHMYPSPLCAKADPPCQAFDPEGVFTTTGALVTCFLGVYYGSHLTKTEMQTPTRVKLQLVFGALLLGGLCLHASGLPINKQLYSSSYILVTAGLCGLILSVLQTAESPRRGGFRDSFLLKAQTPFRWLGLNSILVFAGDELLQRALQTWFWYGDTNKTVYNTIINLITRATHDKAYAKLLYGLLVGFFWICVARSLYHRKVFLKL